jgi:hypothetical protein
MYRVLKSSRQIKDTIKLYKLITITITVIRSRRRKRRRRRRRISQQYNAVKGGPAHCSSMSHFA